MLLSSLETPILLLDRSRLLGNAGRMRAHLQGHGAGLRPHLKTAKSADVARLALEGLPQRITVATLNEAEYFIAHGFDDVLYAVCVTPNKLERICRLSVRAPLSLLTDSLAVAQAIGRVAASHGLCLPVHVEIDCGEGRTGLRPDSAELLAIAAQLDGDPGTRFQGVLTHAGQAYSARSIGEVRRIARIEREAAVDAAARIRDQGIAVDQVSIGSTPTALHGDNFAGVSEVRAGVYLFGDLFQVAIGSCELSDIAVSVLASVISVDAQRRHVVIDAGGLALSKDRSTAGTERDLGYGLVADARGVVFEPRICVCNVHQEHGEMVWPVELPLPGVGDLLRVLPNHACMTAAMYRSYHVLDESGEKVQAIWDKTTGWD